MNDKDRQSHLTEDELIAWLVDGKDVSPRRRTHLSACEHCRREKETIVQQFNRLRRQAESLVPDFSGTLRLPESRRGQLPPRRYLLPAFGSALAMVVLVVAIWWSGTFQFPSAPDSVDTRFAESDDELLMEIGALIGDPLPAAYQEIAVITDVDIDDEVTDFIVPSVENGHEAYTKINRSEVRT